jgi:hypothetical protein
MYVYYYYYATQAMRHVGGEEWASWSSKMQELLLQHQVDGSWSPTLAPDLGRKGGRVTITSLSLLILEVYYRHVPLFLADAQDIPSRQRETDMVGEVRPSNGHTGAPVFIEKDLSNWDGLIKEHWRYKDGELTGTTGEKGIKFNTFLCSKAKYKDFEMKFKVKLTGKGWNGNSGVQIRSQIADNKVFAVAGPQCDMGDDSWGALHGERFGRMMKAAPKEVQKAVKKDDFNDYNIKVVGKHVTIKVNGLTSIDDDVDKLPDDGIIAFQLHAGGPMEVVFKDIELKDLSGQGRVKMIEGNMSETVRPIKQIRIYYPGGVYRLDVVYKGQQPFVVRVDKTLTPLHVSPDSLKWKRIDGGPAEIDLTTMKHGELKVVIEYK